MVTRTKLHLQPIQDYSLRFSMEFPSQTRCTKNGAMHLEVQTHQKLSVQKLQTLVIEQTLYFSLSFFFPGVCVDLKITKTMGNENKSLDQIKTGKKFAF